MCIGVGGADVHRSQAFRAQLVAGDRHGREILQLAALGVFDRIGDQVHLDVGRRKFRPRLEKGDQRRRRQAEETAACCSILERLSNRAEAAGLGVVGNPWLLHAPDDARVDMVAEILADRRQRVGNLDAVRLENLRPADADSSSSCGVAMAPADRMTSRVARASISPQRS